MILQRIKEDLFGTLGELLFDDRSRTGVYTLEQPWRNNEHDVSCIPLGEYLCISHNSPHFHDVWEVNDVPGRTAILIHAGNTVKDTHGCILVGLHTTPEGVGSSQDALSWLRTHLPKAFWLTVLGVPDEPQQLGG
jgi:Family of unknown function (DUF5675)